MLLEISVVILSIVFLLIVALSIPFLLQIWRTAKSITETLHMLDKNLPGILRNLEEITTNINKATHTVNEHMEGLSLVAKRVQGFLGIIMDIESLLRAGIGLPVLRMLRNAIAVVTGVKVFLKVLLSSRESEYGSYHIEIS
jgi:uncharacterized protein YoxC